MQKDFSHQNLQKASFRNEDLSNARFSNTDLRGTDFTGSDLRGADFNHVKTGITPVNTSLIFVAALVVSAFSGYVAMLTGRTIQAMLASDDSKIRTAGIASLVIILLFIIFSLWKGVGNAVYKLVVPVILLASALGIIAYVSGMGTGRGMLFLALSLVLVVAMFIVGTIARAAAGSLSTNIIFIAVAMAGAMFGKSVGGGIGTVILAISCALISKRALSGAKGFESIRKITYYITSKFGTSFRSSRLADAHFSRSRIRNSDFSNADLSLVNWGDSKKVNCLANETLLIEKKESERKSDAEITDTRQE